MSMKKRKVSDIQSVIMTVLSLMTVITSISMGLLLYNRYEMAMRQNEVRNTQNLMESTVNSMEQYLKNMRQISDTVTYNIIQAFDVFYMILIRTKYRVLRFMIWKEILLWQSQLRCRRMA